MNAAVLRVPALVPAGAPPERRGVDRDAVRLLVTDRATGTHRHARFYDLPALLQSGDVLVVNDSATIPAAIAAMRENGDRLQLHVSTRVDERLWMAEPRGAVAVGETLRLPNRGTAVTIARVDPQHQRLWYVRFELPLPMYAYLDTAGEPIRYAHVALRFPLQDYQTTFARHPGSSEMPSAARPFTPRVLDALRRRGVAVAPLTLHCGVSSLETPERPAAERFAVPHATAEAVNAARREGRRVIAAGTTVVRALESAVVDGAVVAASGWTDRVIDATHEIATADALLTGFHEPAGTHLGIVDAFLGRALRDVAYREAAERGYRSHEFGDVHLVL